MQGFSAFWDFHVLPETPETVRALADLVLKKTQKAILLTPTLNRVYLTGFFNTSALVLQGGGSVAFDGFFENSAPQKFILAKTHLSKTGRKSSQASVIVSDDKSLHDLV